MNRFPVNFATLITHIRRMLTCAIFVAAFLPLTAQTPVAQTATLPGHVIKSLANATLIPHTPRMDKEQITLTVVLNLSDSASASALRQDMEDPNSANFKRTISQSEFTARFGPTQDAWNTVLAYLEAERLQAIARLSQPAHNECDRHARSGSAGLPCSRLTIIGWATEPSMPLPAIRLFRR